MPELLTQPLIFGKGIAFIGLAPGACYSVKPEDDSNPTRRVMTSLYVAAAATATATITIGNEQTGG